MKVHSSEAVEFRDCLSKQCQYLTSSLRHLPIPSVLLQFLVNQPHPIIHQEARYSSQAHLQDFLHLDSILLPLNYHLFAFSHHRTNQDWLLLGEFT